MSYRTWNAESAKKRILTRMAEVRDVKIKPYVRDTDLTGLPTNTAYRVDGVHVYVDILNMEELLATTGVEGIRSHQRTLRFLNLHYRAVARILSEADAIHVDFHNQRLHAVVARPYNDEADRIHRAIAISQLIIDVLKKTSEGGEDPLPGASVRVGIDSGFALAVNSGRRGHREPLFLGCPANLAAKRAGGGTATGIYLTNNTRLAIGLDEVKNIDTTSLSALEIADSQQEANLDPTVDSIFNAWQKDLENNPVGKFEFSGHTPPLANLDLELLTAKNSRRQDALSIYADIDGFTKYVADHIDSDAEAKDVVRALHVLRSELNATLVDDFQGLKIRFIGDCVHGILAEGTASTTDIEQSIVNAALCAGALRSSFTLAIEMLNADAVVCDLGLAIGIEYGSIAITRLGVKGDMVRCCISRGVLASELEQLRCNGNQTAIGPVTQSKSPEWLKNWFADSRRLTGVTYAVVKEKLDKKDDVAKSESQKNSLLRPAGIAVATSTTAGFSFGDRPAKPNKPSGFA